MAWKPVTIVLNVVAVGAVGAAAVAMLWSPLRGEDPTVTVYKTSECGCCEEWIAHLERSGFAVEAHDVADLATIKRDRGVTPELASCHTADVEGYVIEGHVPADAIRRLLTEARDVRGLAVPGMPVGSPGMEIAGQPAEPYAILAFDRDGAVQVFDRR